MYLRAFNQQINCLINDLIVQKLEISEINFHKLFEKLKCFASILIDTSNSNSIIYLINNLKAKKLEIFKNIFMSFLNI